MAAARRRACIGVTTPQRASTHEHAVRSRSQPYADARAQADGRGPSCSPSLGPREAEQPVRPTKGSSSEREPTPWPQARFRARGHVRYVQVNRQFWCTHPQVCLRCVKLTHRFPAHVPQCQGQPRYRSKHISDAHRGSLGCGVNRHTSGAQRGTRVLSTGMTGTCRSLLL